MLTTVPVAKLRPSPTNPRKRFTYIDDLVASVKSLGVLQPLLVRELRSTKKKDEGCFEVVAGERRRRAAELAELAEVPVYIRDLNDDEVLDAQLVENDQ